MTPIVLREQVVFIRSGDNGVIFYHTLFFAVILSFSGEKRCPEKLKWGGGGETAGDPPGGPAVSPPPGPPEDFLDIFFICLN
jgi:hypothetical protein